MPLRLIIKNFILDSELLENVQPPVLQNDCQVQQSCESEKKIIKFSGASRRSLLGRGSSIKDGQFIIQINEEDDDDLSGQEIKSVILEERIQVDEATNGLEAVQLFTSSLTSNKCISEIQCKGLYKLIIMDLQMPEMDGFEATEKILETVEQNMDKFIEASTRVVALTSYTDQGTLDRCKKIGFTEVLHKPLKADQI